jgi:hypothetical protein
MIIVFMRKKVIGTCFGMGQIYKKESSISSKIDYKIGFEVPALSLDLSAMLSAL